MPDDPAPAEASPPSEGTLASPPPREPRRGRALATVSLTALGVVYGDIGTSPLYAVRECFHGEYGIEATATNVLGVLSLMFWSLVLVVSVKYLVFILRADNEGEGGVLALTALLPRATFVGKRGSLVLVALGLFGAALLYGDGMITPAISVLSAVEGVENLAPGLHAFVIPITIVILAALFLLQHRGTARVGRLFGPVTLVWMLVLAALGIGGIVRAPEVLLALLPTYAVRFFVENGLHGALVLGTVFLVVTGAEALYADMGHFGRRPIRFAWFVLVLPCLVLSYFGQGALLLHHPELSDHPFYGLVPEALKLPMVLLATVATIIASQAVISGAFSLTRQAVQLGYLPPMRIVHTSSDEIGQIYVPQVNWLLMICTIGLVLGFHSSSQLAAAYGVAVTTTMLITSILFYVVARERWKWSRARAGGLTLVFLVADVAFFGANMTKLLHGAWFPLVIGGALFVVMTTWFRGRQLLAKALKEQALPFEEFVVNVSIDQVPRVDRKAVYMTSDPTITPPALVHNLRHNRVLHAQTAILSIVTEAVPKVPRERKIELSEPGEGFHRIIAHFGFMESPNVAHILAMASEQGLDFPLDEVSFFVGRERIRAKRHGDLAAWRRRLFSFLTRNALDATRFFGVPARQVVELGAQVEL